MPLTQSDRLKGANTSREKRRVKKEVRRKKVKKLHDTGMPKTKIARKLGVSYRTIMSDLKAIQE